MSLSIKSFTRALALVATLGAPAMLLAPSVANAQITLGVSVNFGPPPLPDYEQPELPGPGYLWVPGYWAWDEADADYYWVPGYWSEPPQVGLLWTPGYWGWSDGAYYFHQGYWGDTVGYYGGVSYGFGYNGFGFFGGRWDHGQFQYNRSVTNITNVNVTNVYNQPVTNSNSSRVSYNGGKGGVTARPTPAQAAAANQHHIPATPAQMQHEHAAQALPTSHYSVNKGKPAVAAVAKPGELKGDHVVPAKAAGGPAPARVEPKPGEAKPDATHVVGPKPTEPKANVPKAEPKASGLKAEPKPAASKPVEPVPHQEKAAAHPDKAVAHPNAAQPKPAAPRPAAPAPRVAPAPHPAPIVHAPPPPRAAPVMRAPPPPRPAPHPACPDPKKCH
jgi:hypothetical protein